MIRMAPALLALILALPADAALLMAEGPGRIRVFPAMNDPEGWDAVPRGKITSFSSRDELSGKDLFDTARDKNKATVRLHARWDIGEGDILYVINDKNLIVGKMTVRTVFTSVSFGPMLVGYGNLSLCSVGDRVVARAEAEGARFAYIYKARGDFHESTGSQGEAIREYKTALELDPGNPAAHLALGLVYRKQGNDQFAMKEFQEAYRNRNRLYDNEDRYQLLRGIAEIRFREVYESFIPAKLRDRYREEGMRICREALTVFPRSERMLYCLGVFLYRASEPDDGAARDTFLKLIEINPDHADANVALSELYYRHENIAKARLYAEKAAAADPGSVRARTMLKYLESREDIRRTPGK